MINVTINDLKNIITQSNRIVFLGGAGVSTESGIPDFRSKNGIYKQKYLYTPEHILSLTFFKNNPDIFYNFYREKSLQYILKAKPNAAHLKLAELEKTGKLSAIITQNIDGLHQAAGSKNVLELHGSTNHNYCLKCGRIFNIQYMANTTGIAHCPCGGIIHPGGVLFEESLNQDTLSKSIGYISNADTLIVAGTSLVVYPAAGLIEFYKCHNLILINKTPTVADNSADYVIHGAIGEVLSQI